MFKKRKAEQKLTKVEKDIRDTELIIALILAFMTAIPFIFTYLDFLGLISPISLVWKIILTILLFIAIIFAPFLGYEYFRRYKLNRKIDHSILDYKKEQKINQINKTIFDSLYDSNTAKVREIFRYTYGSVAEWNPINYRDNVIIYDIHEQLRSILISIEKVIININPERFNDRNVSVELAYCYPQDDQHETELPLKKFDEQTLLKKWTLISSGDTSGNHRSVLDYLYDNNSFFTLVDCCGMTFKNDKYEQIKKWQESEICKRMSRMDMQPPTNLSYFISDTRDQERADDGKVKGSIIGTVINVRNDNPAKIFVKAILTINTYGEQISTATSENGGRDADGLTEDDYENIFCDTIIGTYTKLLETELAQMYIRHSIRSGGICPITGKLLLKRTYRQKNVLHARLGTVSQKLKNEVYYLTIMPL